jgi:hypothetical protein
MMYNNNTQYNTMTVCNVVQYETKFCYCLQFQGHCATMLSKKVRIVTNITTIKSFPAGRIRHAPRAASAAAAAVPFALLQNCQCESPPDGAHLRGSPVISPVLWTILLAPRRPNKQCLHSCVFMAANRRPVKAEQQGRDPTQSSPTAPALGLGCPPQRRYS